MRLLCEASSMELKVWVDGIQRVVCGATLDTTCQDVVIALAHAMGRTGRFTLIEKWRDVDRPLTPSECPLRVLYKWGEYAGEVRFILCQADSDKQKSQNNDKLWKKTGDQSHYLHNFTPQHTSGLGGGGDASVKRSLTFSGAHNYSSNLPNLSLSSSQPTSKFQKTHLGPVPNGDVRPRPPLQQSSRQTPSPRPPGHVTGGYSGGSSGGGQQIKTSGPPFHAQNQEHPIPHPRHRRASPAPAQRGMNTYSEGAPASGTTMPSSSSALPSLALSASSQQGFHKNRVSPIPAQTAVAQSQPQQPSQPRPQPHARAHTPSGARSSIPSHSPTPLPRHTHRVDHSPPHSRESTPPPLPTSLPPDVRSYPAHSHISVHDRQRLSPDPHQALTAVEASLGSANHSRQASLEIEEYDLDRNFPDVTRDAVRGERPSVSLEYRLDDGVTAGSGGHMEGEHAKLVRLVNIQQERLKTQESQIGMINTEITALEEREKEYEDQLQVIMEELLLQENRQHDLEPELAELERVEWENVLDGEKKCEQDLKRQIDLCKSRLEGLEQKLEQTQKKERDLQEEISAEQEKLASEKQRLQDAEAKAAEEASKLKDEIQKVKVQLSDLEKTVSESQASLSSVDGDLKSVEADLAKKTAELEEMEKELKTENLKDFTAHPVAKETTKPKDSGETIIKILEERLSPRPPSRGPDSPSSPPFISALAAKTQSGVWV